MVELLTLPVLHWAARLSEGGGELLIRGGRETQRLDLRGSEKWLLTATTLTVKREAKISTERSACGRDDGGLGEVLGWEISVHIDCLSWLQVPGPGDSSVLWR